METGTNSYKLFKQNKEENAKVSIEKLSPGSDYYEMISRQRDIGNCQITIPYNVLLALAKKAHPDFKVDSVQLNSGSKYSQMIKLVLDSISKGFSSIDSLENMINGIVKKDSEFGLIAINLSNEFNSLQMKVDGSVDFKREPSAELKGLIVDVVREEFT